MRNIFIKHIDKLLLDYYKEWNFELLSTPHLEINCKIGEVYYQNAMWLIDIMKELELVNSNEHQMLREVYQAYFDSYPI